MTECQSVEVVVATSHTYEKLRALERVRRLDVQASELVAKMRRFVQLRHTVLSKLNRAAHYLFEEGCTTDSYLVDTLVHLVGDSGAVPVQAAEFCGGLFGSTSYETITGRIAIAECAGAELIDLCSDDVPDSCRGSNRADATHTHPLIHWRTPAASAERTT